MICDILMNLVIWYHPTDGYDHEVFIKYSKKNLPAYNSGDYAYFKNNKERPQSHHKNFRLNNVSGFYITSILKFLVKILV